MNRILFVGLCLVGIVAFVLVNANSEFEKESKKEIAKEHYKKIVY